MARKPENGVDLDASVMAIRELLMEYYKGACIQRLMENNNIHLRNVSFQARFNYERREHRNKKPQQIVIGNVPIAQLEHEPDSIVFYSKVLNRSPQMRYVYKELKKFMSTYLPAVKTSYSRKDTFFDA